MDNFFITGQDRPLYWFVYMSYYFFLMMFFFFEFSVFWFVVKVLCLGL